MDGSLILILVAAGVGIPVLLAAVVAGGRRAGHDEALPRGASEALRSIVDAPEPTEGIRVIDRRIPRRASRATPPSNRRPATGGTQPGR